MDGPERMLAKNKGFTLIELLVTLVVGTIAVSILLSILKNAYLLSDQLKLKLDSQTYVNTFIKNFHEDVESAGYVDFSKQDLNGSQLNSGNCLSSICVADGDIKLKTNLLDTSQFRVTENIEYVVKKIDPPRSTIHPDELGIFKYRAINGVSVYGQSDSNTLVLAGVKSFNCSLDDTSNPKVVDCHLTVYKSMLKSDTDTFKIYAINEN